MNPTIMRSIFKITDVVLIIAILFNFGAATLTHLMIASQIKVPVVTEANPVMASVNKFPQSPTPTFLKILKSLMIQSVLWAIPVGYYFYFKKKIIDDFNSGVARMYDLEVLIVTILITFLFFLQGHDFSRDLGNYLGLIL